MNIKKYSLQPLCIAISLLTTNSLAAESTTNNLLDPNYIPTEKEDNLNNLGYQVEATNSSWEQLNVSDEFYEDPYQISLFSPQNGEDSERLMVTNKVNIFLWFWCYRRISCTAKRHY